MMQLLHSSSRKKAQRPISGPLTACLPVSELLSMHVVTDKPIEVGLESLGVMVVMGTLYKSSRLD